MKFASGFFCALSIFAAALGTVPATAQDVVVETNIQAISRRGVLPVKIFCSDNRVLALAQHALGAHGAFELSARSGASAAIRITNSGTGLTAVCEGANKAFSETLSVSGAGERAVLELCDKIVVAVGKTYGWNLKPVFATTRLAFSSTRSGSREIYVSNVLVREIKQATNLKSFSAMPHWHPGGNQIVFTTYAFSGGADVYSVNLSTAKVSRIAAYKNTNNGGAVSPDGQKIALALSVRGPMDIYVAPANGGNPKILVKDPNVKISPAWSPDGKTIVFATGPTGSPRLHTVSANGGAISRLPVDLPCYASDPDWSRAEPTKIAFSYIGRGRNSIAVYDTKTRKTKDLGPLLPGRKISNPTWCADGRHVVAVEEVGKNSSLVLVDTEGENKVKITKISPASMRDCFDPDAISAK